MKAVSLALLACVSAGFGAAAQADSLDDMARARGLAAEAHKTCCMPNPISAERRHWQFVREDASRSDYLNTNLVPREGGHLEVDVLSSYKKPRPDAQGREIGSERRYWRLACAQGRVGEFGYTTYKDPMQSGDVVDSAMSPQDMKMRTPAPGPDADLFRAVCKLLSGDTRPFGWGVGQPDDSVWHAIWRSARPFKGETGGPEMTAAMRVSTAEATARIGRAPRQTHLESAEAHRCLAPVDDHSFGKMRNRCETAIEFAYCALGPQQARHVEDFDCEKRQFAYLSVPARGTVPVHLTWTRSVYWFACRGGTAAVFDEFVAGRGIAGRCIKLSGG